MSYKATLISSKDGSFHFMREEFAQAGIPHFFLEDIAPFERSLSYPSAWVLEDGKKKRILDFHVWHDAKDSQWLIDGFVVGDDFKGRGLGAIGLKALFGIMKEVPAQLLVLPKQLPDGPSFWSYYGAIPASEPRSLAQDIQNVLAVPHSGLDENDRKNLQLAATTAADSPHLGWRIFSQDDLSAAGKKARYEIFKGICEDKTTCLSL